MKYNHLLNKELKLKDVIISENDTRLVLTDKEDSYGFFLVTVCEIEKGEVPINNVVWEFFKENVMVTLCKDSTFKDDTLLTVPCGVYFFVVSEEDIIKY